MKKRVKLTFPQERIKDPVLFEMAKEFNIMPNIRRAKVTETFGEMVLELDGEEHDLEAGLDSVKAKGIQVELVEGDVLE